MDHEHAPAHAHAHDRDHEHAEGGLGHETRDANLRRVVTYAAVLTVVLVVVHLSMLGAYELLKRRSMPEAAAVVPITIPEQRRLMQQAEDETLSTYGWVDRKAGVVRIPIDRALELAAERGVPHGKGPKTPDELNSHHGTPVPVPGPGEPAPQTGKPTGPPEKEAQP